MEETVPHWKQAQIEAEKKRALKEKFPDLGKIVKFSGEYGVVILGSYTDGVEMQEQVVRWDTPNEFDSEQYGFFDYEYLDSYDFKYINMDGSLKAEFKKSGNKRGRNSK